MKKGRGKKGAREGEERIRRRRIPTGSESSVEPDRRHRYSSVLRRGVALWPRGSRPRRVPRRPSMPYTAFHSLDSRSEMVLASITKYPMGGVSTLENGSKAAMLVASEPPLAIARTSAVLCRSPQMTYNVMQSEQISTERFKLILTTCSSISRNQKQT